MVLSNNLLEIVMMPVIAHLIGRYSSNGVVWQIAATKVFSVAEVEVAIGELNAAILVQTLENQAMVKN